MKQSDPSRPFRIASYNIRKSRGLDGVRDPARVLRVLNGLGADVVVLQEADHRLGARPSSLPVKMIRAHTDFYVVSLATNKVSLGWHGNAVLIHKDTVVAQTARIALPGVEPRGAVSVTIQNGPEIIGVHLGLLRRSRRQQLQTIVDNITEPANTVMIGDMNEWSPTRGFEPLLGRFALHTPGHSFHAARPLASLDRLAIGGDLRLVDAGVDQSPLARRASDHLPIWADLSYLENITGSFASRRSVRVAAPMTKS